MKYIVYLTVNTINHKIYIGYHKTEDPLVFDGYLSNGIHINSPSSYKKSQTAMQYAVNKYGVDAFHRYTIATVNTEKEAKDIETLLVNKEFLKRKDVYNMALGGDGGRPAKEIYKYSLSGEFISEYPDTSTAASLHNCSEEVLRRAAMEKSTAQNHLWSYIKVDNLDISEHTIHNSIRPIYMYDAYGNYVKTFANSAEMAVELNVSRPSINRALQGGYKIEGMYISLEKYEHYNIKNNAVTIRGKKIYLYTSEGKFYKEFESPIECARHFGQNSSSAISSCIRLKRAYRGYQISLEKLDSMNPITLRNQKTPVSQFDLDGNWIRDFESITEAINEYGGGVKRVIKGQARQTKGYTFKIKS